MLRATTDMVDDPETYVFGREAEHDQIEQLLDHAGSGPPAWRWRACPGSVSRRCGEKALALARRRGLQVIATTPSEPDRRSAFAGLGDLFDGLPDDVLADLPGPQRRAHRRRVVRRAMTARRRPIRKRCRVPYSAFCAVWPTRTAAGGDRRRAVARSRVGTRAGLRSGRPATSDLRAAGPAAAQRRRAVAGVGAGLRGWRGCRR